MIIEYKDYNIIQYEDKLIEIQKFIGEKEIKRNYVYGYIKEKYITEELLEELLSIKKNSKINIKVSVEVLK